MRADSGFGRIIGALSRPAPPSTSPFRYGIRRNSASGRLVGALARVPLNRDDMVTANRTTATLPRHHDQQYYFSGSEQDIVDFGIGATKRRRATGLDTRRNRVRYAPVIIMPLVILAFITAAHLIPLLIRQSSPESSHPVAPSKPAPFSFTGYAFDTCTTPSVTTMRNWLSSPYRAIFVYVGGVNSACTYGNLSASWVRAVRKLGWTVFPVYVGPEAPNWDFPGTKIDSRHASAEGMIAAQNAVSDARLMGIPSNVPIFYDLEGFPDSGADGRASLNAVREFISTWDSTLEREHTHSGVATSCDNAPDVFADPAEITLPDVLFVSLWNNRATFSLDCAPTNDSWSNAHVNQYKGDTVVTFDGITLNADLDTVKIKLK
jgi:hypothetical protein